MRILIVSVTVTAVAIPFSAGNSDPIFTVTLAFNFGR
jgi:hypothetical protein